MSSDEQNSIEHCRQILPQIKATHHHHHQLSLTLFKRNYLSQI